MNTVTEDLLKMLEGMRRTAPMRPGDYQGDFSDGHNSSSKSTIAALERLLKKHGIIPRLEPYGLDK